MPRGTPKVKPAVKKTPRATEPEKTSASKVSSAALDAVLSAVEGKYGKGAVMKAAATDSDVERIPFNHPELDRMTGGGIPRGRVSVFVGNPGGGKSTSTLEVIASAQQVGLRAALIELEGAFDPDYASCLGVNVDDLLVAQSNSAEEALDVMEMLIKSGAIGLVVLDSVAGMATQAELDGSMEDKQVGDKARLMSKAIRKITTALNATKTAAIFVNQWRQGIGYNAGKEMPGGKALPYASSLTLDFTRKENLTNSKGDPYGQVTIVKVMKTRVGPPFAKGEIELKFPRYSPDGIIIGSGGFNRMAAFIDAALDEGRIKQKGAWFADAAGNNIAQGREKLVKLMETDASVLKKVKGE